MHCFLLDIFKCSPIKKYPPRKGGTVISTAPFSCPGVNMRHWSCEHFVLHGFRCWNGCILGWEWWMYQLETWLLCFVLVWKRRLSLCPFWMKWKNSWGTYWSTVTCNPRRLQYLLRFGVWEYVFGGSKYRTPNLGRVLDVEGNRWNQSPKIGEWLSDNGFEVSWMLASHRKKRVSTAKLGCRIWYEGTKWICSSSANSWKWRLFWHNVLERSCCDVCFVPGLGSPQAFCCTRGLLTFSHVWLWKEKKSAEAFEITNRKSGNRP